MELQDDGALPVVSDTSDMDMMVTNADMGDVQFAGAESLEEAASSLGCPKAEKEKAHKGFKIAEKKTQTNCRRCEKSRRCSESGRRKGYGSAASSTGGRTSSTGGLDRKG